MKWAVTASKGPSLRVVDTHGAGWETKEEVKEVVVMRLRRDFGTPSLAR